VAIPDHSRIARGLMVFSHVINVIMRCPVEGRPLQPNVKPPFCLREFIANIGIRLFYGWGKAGNSDLLGAQVEKRPGSEQGSNPIKVRNYQ